MKIQCANCGRDFAEWATHGCLPTSNNHVEATYILGPLAEFDAALATITQRRGEAYGHPGDDFQRVAVMKRSLPSWRDLRLQHIAEMLMVKLGRLAHDPTHVDSLVDIAGYARTWVMILERDYHGGQATRDANPGLDIPPVPGDRETSPHPDGPSDPNDGGNTSVVGGPRRTGDSGARGPATAPGTSNRPGGD